MLGSETLATRNPASASSYEGRRPLRVDARRLFELLWNDWPSLDQLVIFCMGAYPHPHIVGTILHGKRAVVETYSR